MRTVRTIQYKPSSTCHLDTIPLRAAWHEQWYQVSRSPQARLSHLHRAPSAFYYEW